MSLITIHNIHFHVVNPERIKEIMETLATLNEKFDLLKAATEAERAEVLAAIQALKDQIAAGSPVTQEQLDALGARLVEETERVVGIVNPEDVQG